MRRRIAALALAGTLALSGCATGDDSSNEVTGQLQTTVAQLTASAASGDLQAALDDLARLEQSTKDAYAAGRISQAKHDEILTAIATVRQKLEAQLTAEGGTPAPAPSQTGSGGTSSAGRGSSPAPEDEKAEAPEEEKPAAPAPTTSAQPSTTPTPKPTGSQAPQPSTPSVAPPEEPSEEPTEDPAPKPEDGTGQPSGQSQLQGAEQTTQSAE